METWWKWRTIDEECLNRMLDSFEGWCLIPLSCHCQDSIQVKVKKTLTTRQINWKMDQSKTVSSQQFLADINFQDLEGTWDHFKDDGLKDAEEAMGQYRGRNREKSRIRVGIWLIEARRNRTTEEHTGSTLGPSVFIRKTSQNGRSAF